MKKIIILFALALLICANVFAYDVDVIITRSREQIQCLIISQEGEQITYTNLNDKQVYQIAKSDVEKVYIHNAEPAKNTAVVKPKQAPQKEVKEAPKVEKSPVKNALAEQSEAKQDLIVTMDAQQIKSKIIEVSKNEIRYKEIDNLDGPTYVLNTEEIASIIYANGKVSVFQHEPKNAFPQEDVHPFENSKSAQTMSYTPLSTEKNSIARVEKVNGILVFTDCMPAAQYDVIGEVSVTGYESKELQNSLGQYQAVRDELIKAAKAANGLAEGVILTLVTGGTDKAHIIKFRDHSENCALANAKRYRGIYVFCDCIPLSAYDYIGTLKGKATLIPQYTYLRDDFIKKCAKKYKNANGIIIQLVSGGKDSAEAIKL